MNFIARIFALIIFVPVFSYACPTYDVVFHDMVCLIPYKNYNYKTCSSITVTIDHFILVIPKNFQTDLASIPRWLWIIIAPTRSDIIAPAILHDYIYSCHDGFTRKEADNILYDALIQNGVSNFRAYEMYLAVRIFGGEHYDLKQIC